MNTIHQKASDRAFAKLTMLLLEKERIEQDLRKRNTGGLTLEEFKSLHKGHLQEIKIWNYIASLIEKNT
jgi:hypothetical protein